MSDFFRRHRRDLALAMVLTLFTVVRGLLWIGAYPILKIVDEPAHFDNVQFRAEHGLRAPRADGSPLDKVLGRSASVELRSAWESSNGHFRDAFVPNRFGTPHERGLQDLAGNRANRVTTGQSTSLATPGVYYTFAALWYRAFDRSSVLVRMFAIRTASLVFALMLVIGTFVAARCAMPSRLLAFTAAMLAALQPLAIQQTVAISSDAGVIGLCALVFCLQMVLVLRIADPPPALLPLIAVTLAIAVETKAQAYGLVPGAIFLGGWMLERQPRSRRTQLVVAGSLLAFWSVRAICAVGLDRAVGSGARSGFAALRALPIPSLIDFVPWLWSREDAFWTHLFRTGWGTLGWLDVVLSDGWFAAIHFMARLLWLGLAAAIVRAVLRPGDRFFWRLSPALFALFTVVTGLGFVLFLAYFAEVQLRLQHAISGRAALFLLPAGAIVATIAMGSLVPSRLRPLCAALLVAGMMMIAAGSLLTEIGYQYVG